MRFATSLLFLTLLLAFSAPAHAIVVVPPADVVVTDPAASAAEAKAAATAYKASLKAMSPAERRAHKKAQRKQVREAIQQYKQDKAAGAPATDTNTLLLVILAILLPPVAVLVHQGEINNKFWIALILTLLLYLPGLIYALLVIFGDAKKK